MATVRNLSESWTTGDYYKLVHWDACNAGTSSCPADTFSPVADLSPRCPPAFVSLLPVTPSGLRVDYYWLYTIFYFFVDMAACSLLSAPLNVEHVLALGPHLQLESLWDIHSQKDGKLRVPISAVSCFLFSLYCDYPRSLKLKMSSERRNMFYQDKKQETTEIV
ncbi:hypothetical protein AAG570_001764 [Ranatra chinensis]|uniref:Uncharacterized protein n=1 Tax=Ranatra chinensis TaxID=642074 RepID=A0ABD0YBE9_9HEMI